MKKIILSLFLSIIGFIGFSSASSITLTSNSNGSYNPSLFSVSNSNLSISSFICDIPKDDGESSCELGILDADAEIDSENILYTIFAIYDCGIDWDGEDESACDLVIDDGGLANSDLNGDYILYSFLMDEVYSFSSITLDGNFSGNGGEIGGGESGGGESGGNNVIGGIIEGGTSQLSPVVSAIYSVMLQFIPYVVYIGIGILLFTLGFYAIKWLVNWLTSKITNYFK